MAIPRNSDALLSATPGCIKHITPATESCYLKCCMLSMMCLNSFRVAVSAIKENLYETVIKIFLQTSFHFCCSVNFAINVGILKHLFEFDTPLTPHFRAKSLYSSSENFCQNKAL